MKIRIGHFLSCCSVMISMWYLLLFHTGCATERTIRIIDEDGQAVPNALIIFHEYNSALYHNTDIGKADFKGECIFKAIGVVRVEAFDSTGKWARYSIAQRETGTVILTSKPYNGYIIARYLRSGKVIPEKYRSQLESFLNQKQ